MKKLKINLIAPIIIGFIGFLLVVGISTLNVQNIAWLSKGDALFNYVGWEIFRQSPWTNPIGLNPNYGLEFGSSIVYSDSVPILAILFKLFSSLLGHPFQYFGIWLLLCFILQAFFGLKLAELITKNKWLQLCISVIFLFTPAMLFRTNVHLALAGHFVILWALYLNLKRNSSSWSWVLLITITLGIHFYLFVMVIILWFGSLLDRLFTKQSNIKSLAFECGFIFLTIGIFVWQYGYLAISVGSSSGIGYGYYQFNLLGFFNPMGWSMFVTRNIYNPPHFESFAYAGAGIFSSLVLGALLLGRKKERSELFRKIYHYKFLVISIFLMLCISISQNVYIGNSYIQLPLNEHILFALNALGASSRFSWPFLYSMTFVSFWLIIKGYRKGIVAIFFILCLLQVCDISKGWLKLHHYFSHLKGKNIEHTLTHEFWSEVPKQYSALKLIPPQHWPDRWNNFAAYAAQNKIATNTVFLARHDLLKVIQAKDAANNELSSGQFNPKTIYVFQKWSDNLNQISPNFDPKRDLLARINGVTVLAPNYKMCRECKQVDPSLEMDSLTPKLNLNESVHFSNESMGSDLLIKGWSQPDSWGVWSSGTSSTIAVPLGKYAPSKIQFTFRGMVGPKHEISNIEVLLNGEYQKTIQVTKQLNNIMSITIPDKFKHDSYVIVEFKYLNPTSPKGAGFGNQDDRLLTLGIESVQILK